MTATPSPADSFVRSAPRLHPRPSLWSRRVLERELPDEIRELDGEGAREVTTTLADCGFYGRTATEFGEDERAALSEFRGANNFENHDIPILEDALARGWNDAEGSGETRLVNAIWHGISGRERA